jgi:hypothetical protein
VTKAFVLGLAAMATLFGLAVLVAAWGLLALATDTKPVESQVPFFVAPLILVIALAELYGMLWLIALRALRGNSAPPWGLAFLASAGAVVVWAVIGFLAGFSVAEAFLGFYVLALAASWFLAAMLFWLLLARQVFTDRPTPLWPWERNELRDRERDA